MTSPEKFAKMNADIEILKSSVTQCVQASESASKASEKVSDQISELLSEMKANDVREEYKLKDFNALRDVVRTMDRKLDSIIPTYNRVAKFHERIDKLYDGMFSNYGKLLSIVILIGLLYLAGLDLSSLIK